MVLKATIHIEVISITNIWACNNSATLIKQRLQEVQSKTQKVTDNFNISLNLKQTMETK